jgi:hypothetical protein
VPLLHFISRFAAAGALLLASAVPAAAAGDAIEPLASVRTQDDIVITVGTNHVTFTETIVLAPIKRKPDHERPDPVNLVHVLLTPLWVKEGTSMRPAFPALKPTMNMSHGRVRRIMLVRPDGDHVSSLAEFTPDCRYALTVEFGHVIPDKFTVTVFQSSNTGVAPTAELMFTASNDGQPRRSGAPASHYTSIRLKADPPLAPWVAMQGEERLKRVDAYSVRIEREKTHRIRFAAEAE